AEARVARDAKWESRNLKQQQQQYQQEQLLEQEQSWKSAAAVPEEPAAEEQRPEKRRKGKAARAHAVTMEARCPCGGKLPAGAVFCPSCGARCTEEKARAAKSGPQEPPTAAPEEPAAEKQRPGKRRKGSAATPDLPSEAPKLVEAAAGPENQKSLWLSSATGKAAERLRGSRFRWLNEQLYTITGDE
ncbi:unnamed protein product, partial [Polarella glacialis]